MTVLTARIGDVLSMTREPIELEPDREYRRIGIYSWGKGILHRDAVPPSELGSMRYFKFPPGALIMSNIQAWERATAVTTEAEAHDFVCSNRFLPYVPTRPKTVLPQFVHHFFQSDIGHAELMRASPGTQVRNRTLSKELFEAIEVPIPSYPEQRRIADHLDSIEEQTIALKRGDVGESIRLLPRLIDEVFSNSSLPRTTLDELCINVNRTVHPGDNRGGAEEFIGLEHIEPHTGRRIGSRPLGEEAGRKLRFLPDEITYGYLRPYLNKAWVADREGLCSVEQYVLKPHNGVNPVALGFALRTASTLEQAIAATHTLQLPRLRLSSLMAMTVPDVRKADLTLVRSLRSVAAKVAVLRNLAQHRHELIEGLLPAARNEIFKSLR